MGVFGHHNQNNNLFIFYSSFQIPSEGKTLICSMWWVGLHLITWHVFSTQIFQVQKQLLHLRCCNLFPCDKIWMWWQQIIKIIILCRTEEITINGFKLLFWLFLAVKIPMWHYFRMPGKTKKWTNDVIRLFHVKMKDSKHNCK